jgi:uncharacterized integral membrane protein
MAGTSRRRREPEESEQGARTEYRATGVFWMLALLFVPVVLLIITLAQNVDPVGFDFLWWSFSPPLFVLMLAAAAAGAALTEAVAAAWRHHRRRVWTERSELNELRSRLRS